MEIALDDHSAMQSIVESTERTRAAFVAAALKGDEGIAKLVTQMHASPKVCSG